ncbi:hypothetical protein [Anaerobranca gottschalkii]|uniref:Uncharacterized protein n=1 Tax=Anaerobranca gottschalkii DSM 13577 TaxID=1120990 RepID=A0A1I0B0Y7_9FIRM|nr:hypothetical protein [Anaerobranca gottschalkii]SES99737.1 hypothetical protein SAMN03080614_102920 [Anaerobranca gottschalkii DSM 13577]
MDLICPVCNGLKEIYLQCPICHGEMEEGGSLQQFFDPYSPYLSQEIMSLEGMSDKVCVHLIFCSNCGIDKRISVNKIKW